MPEPKSSEDFPMDELLPVEAYRESPPGIVIRTALVMSALWGVPMTALMVASDPSHLKMTEVLGIGLAASLAFGTIWTAWVRLSLRRFTQRLYAGDPTLVPPPPDESADRRLLCSWLKTPRFSVGGHLYLGSNRWTFVPHRRNRTADESPILILLTPPPRIRVTEWRSGGLARLMGAGVIRSVRIEGDGGTWLLLVPRAEAVAEILSRAAGAQPG